MDWKKITQKKHKAFFMIMKWAHLGTTGYAGWALGATRSWKPDPCLRNYTLVALISFGRKWKFRCTGLRYLCWSRFHQGCGNPHGYSESSSPRDRLTSAHAGRPGWGWGKSVSVNVEWKERSWFCGCPQLSRWWGIAQAGAPSRICQQKPVQRRKPTTQEQQVHRWASQEDFCFRARRGSQGDTKTWLQILHLKQWYKWMYLQSRNRLIGLENKFMVIKVESWRGIG